MADFTIFPRRPARAAFSAIVVCTFMIYLFQYYKSLGTTYDPRSAFPSSPQVQTEEVRGSRPRNCSDAAAALYNPPPRTLATIDSKYAFATLLAADYQGRKDDDMEKDHYFVAVRILAYQFLHAPETRSRQGYPFIVLVTPEVCERKRERLRRDGAVVLEAPPFEVASWFQVPNAQWRSVLAKMRVLELTQFERVLLLDGDTQLTR